MRRRALEWGMTRNNRMIRMVRTDQADRTKGIKQRVERGE
jgi:hypothetical protein